MNIGKKDIIEWDVQVWWQTILFWENYLPPSGHEKKVLELAANKGGLSLYFAEKGYDVTCSDIKDPEQQARPHHAKYSVQSSIHYQTINALSTPYKDNTFEIVVFKSFLGYLSAEQQCDVMTEIKRILKPGGMLLFAENLDGSYLHKWVRRRFVPWGKEWNYVSIEKTIELVGVFDNFHYKTNGLISIFIRSELLKKIVGPLDNFISRIVPSRFNYVLFGVAKKNS